MPIVVPLTEETPRTSPAVAFKRELSEEAKQCVVWLETIQVHKLRTIFDSIKDIITEVNLKFFPEGDPDHGMIMSSFDTTGVALVRLVCPAADISDAGIFHCKRPVRAGIHVAKFHRLLKTLKNHDSLVLFMKDDTSGFLHLRANRVGAGSGARPQEFQCMLLALNDDAISVYNHTFTSVRHIPAEHFQGLVRDLIQSVVPPWIGVSSKDGLLALHGNGDFAHANFPIDQIELPVIPIESSGTNTPPIKRSESDEAHASLGTTTDFYSEFSERIMGVVIKPSQLCQNIHFYVDKDSPLVVVYPLTGLGELTFYIAPRIPENYSGSSDGIIPCGSGDHASVQPINFAPGEGTTEAGEGSGLSPQSLWDMQNRRRATRTPSPGSGRFAEGCMLNSPDEYDADATAAAAEAQEPEETFGEQKDDDYEHDVTTRTDDYYYSTEDAGCERDGGYMYDEQEFLYD